MSGNQEQIETAARALNHAGWTCCGGFGCEPGIYDECEDCRRVCNETARAVIAAIHPTVTSVEELDALPFRTIITAGQFPYMRGKTGRWAQVGTRATLDSKWLADVLPEGGSYMVLHIPGGAA